MDDNFEKFKQDFKQVLEREFEGMHKLHIDPFLKRKRGKAKEICEFIINYLHEHMSWENQGWVLSIELWDEFGKRNRYNPNSISRQLKDMENAHLIKRAEHLLPATRQRRGKQKTKKNVFYSLVLDYAGYRGRTAEEWAMRNRDLLIENDDLLNKIMTALSLLGDIEKMNPNIFKELWISSDNKLYSDTVNIPESNAKMIVNRISHTFALWKASSNESPEFNAFPSVDDISKSILTARAKELPSRKVPHTSRRKPFTKRSPSAPQ